MFSMQAMMPPGDEDEFTHPSYPPTQSHWAMMGQQPNQTHFVQKETNVDVLRSLMSERERSRTSASVSRQKRTAINVQNNRRSSSKQGEKTFHLSNL